jgi:RNA polymerase sigma factor (sigma-70 family)
MMSPGGTAALLADNFCGINLPGVSRCCPIGKGWQEKGAALTRLRRPASSNVQPRSMSLPSAPQVRSLLCLMHGRAGDAQCHGGGSGDQHGSHQNPYNFTLGHSVCSPNSSPFHFVPLYWMIAVWMRAAMTGDAGAYRQLLVSLAPHVRAVARSRCRSLGAPEDEVEDIVQEVLLTIHLKRGTWDQSRPIGPWVAAITRNRVIDVMRRRGRHVTVPIGDFVDRLQAEDQKPELPTRDIDSILVRLKPEQREIVRSMSLHGSSIRDTASQLQITEGAVQVTLHRALKALAVFYQRSARED